MIFTKHTSHSENLILQQVSNSNTNLNVYNLKDSCSVIFRLDAHLGINSTDTVWFRNFYGHRQVVHLRVLYCQKFSSSPFECVFAASNSSRVKASAEERFCVNVENMSVPKSTHVVSTDNRCSAM